MKTWTKTLAVIVVVVGALLVAVSCTDADAATRALEDHGFTEIETTGYAIGACGRDDSTCTGFSARNANGRRVTGAVGCGWAFKGCTVRMR